MLQLQDFDKEETHTVDTSINESLRDKRNDELNALVKEWQLGTSNKHLHDFLGMSWDGYTNWALNPSRVLEIEKRYPRKVGV